MPSTFEFSPVKLVYGGEALGFHAGRTILAPFVLPGERAEVKAVRLQKGVVHARPLRILEPSPERIAPMCKYFARCGGCHYQHLPHADQKVAKSEILRETLRRLGQVKWDGPIPTHSGPAWNYRNEARFKIGRSPGGAVALGFFEAESNQLIAIDFCPILSPRLNELLAVLRLESWNNLLAEAREVELLADDGDQEVMMTLHGIQSQTGAEALASRCLSELPGVSTVAVVRTGVEARAGAGPGRTSVVPDADRVRAARQPFHRETAPQEPNIQVFGNPHLAYHVGEFTYRISPTAFFQSARFLLPEFVTAVLGDERGGVAMDLYAGVGLFTLPLAKRFDEVIAVEAHPQAARDLAANASAVPGRRIRAVASTADDFLRRCAQMGPDLVVLDPPRAGMGAAALQWLAALRPRRLRYVSCSPPTFARDLACLLKNGYSLDALEIFDFFPQTYHIESLACLSRPK